MDFTRFGPVREIAAHVAGPGGVPDTPLTFQAREHAWSIPGDPRTTRLSDIGADLRIVEWSGGPAEVWRLEVELVRQAFKLH